ncbi:Lipopolysaccharide assembly protein B [Clostridium neonatale]|nr:Lipopolysaccharide assembly protein B [Clostridium neonatale]
MDDDVYVQFYNNIGKSYKNIKEFDNAIKYYDEGICKLENEPSLYYNKAKTLMAMRKYEEAIEVYIEGAKLNDADKEDFYDEIGDAYKALQEYDNAIIWYEKVIKLNPNHSFEYRQIGNAYERKNHYDTAIAYYLKQIKINDNNPLNYICLAGAYKYKKQKIKARIYYKKALKLYMDRNRDSSFDVCEIGRCYMELNKHKEAVFYLNKAIEKQCNNCDFDGCYEAYYILGEMYENEKDYETAYKYYKKADDIVDSIYKQDVEALDIAIKKILNID